MQNITFYNSYFICSELNDKIDEVLEDIRKTVEVGNEDNEEVEIEEIPNAEGDEGEGEEDEVDSPLFIPKMSAGPENAGPIQEQNGSIPRVSAENITSIPPNTSSHQPSHSQNFVQSNQELTPEFQEKKIKSLEDRFKSHLQEKINILKVSTQTSGHSWTPDRTLGPHMIGLGSWSSSAFKIVQYI